MTWDFVQPEATRSLVREVDSQVTSRSNVDALEGQIAFALALSLESSLQKQEVSRRLIVREGDEQLDDPAGE